MKERREHDLQSFIPMLIENKRTDKNHPRLTASQYASIPPMLDKVTEQEAVPMKAMMPNEVGDGHARGERDEAHEGRLGHEGD